MLKCSGLFFIFLYSLLYFKRMITFALRNVLCTKSGIPVYFQESEPGNYLAGPVWMPE